MPEKTNFLFRRMSPLPFVQSEEEQKTGHDKGKRDRRGEVEEQKQRDERENINPTQQENQ